MNIDTTNLKWNFDKNFKLSELTLSQFGWVVMDAWEIQGYALAQFTFFNKDWNNTWNGLHANDNCIPMCFFKDITKCKKHEPQIDQVHVLNPLPKLNFWLCFKVCEIRTHLYTINGTFP